MTKMYRITPLEKKNVENVIDVYQTLPDGTVRGFTVSEWFRWGQGFRNIEEPITQRDLTHNGGLRFEHSLGWGSELDDLCSVYVEFQGEFTDQEKQYITDLVEYETQDEQGLNGTQWLFDGEHDWLVDDDYVLIHGPIQIDIIEEDQYNQVLETGIDPAPDAVASNAWPFPT